jgi:hypothetical protein
LPLLYCVSASFRIFDLNINPVCPFFSPCVKRSSDKMLLPIHTCFVNLNYNIFINSYHRLYIVPEYPGRSSELALPPQDPSGEGDTLACGKGAGGANSGEGTAGTLYTNPLSLTQTVPAQRDNGNIAYKTTFGSNYDPHVPTHTYPITLKGNYLQN